MEEALIIPIGSTGFVEMTTVYVISGICLFLFVATLFLYKKFKKIRGLLLWPIIFTGLTFVVLVIACIGIKTQKGNFDTLIVDGNKISFTNKDGKIVEETTLQDIVSAQLILETKSFKSSRRRSSDGYIENYKGKIVLKNGATLISNRDNNPLNLRMNFQKAGIELVQEKDSKIFFSLLNARIAGTVLTLITFGVLVLLILYYNRKTNKLKNK